MTSPPGVRHLSRMAAVLVATATLLGACGSGGDRLGPPRTFGNRSVGLLVLQPPGGAKPPIDEAAARRILAHPAMVPVTRRRLVLWALARVTAGPQGMSGPANSSTVFRQTLAWVAVYEDLGGGAGTCPAGAPRSAAPRTTLPPLLPHYYFAYIIDAAQGSAVLWTEDESARSLRRCAGVSG